VRLKRKARQKPKRGREANKEKEMGRQKTRQCRPRRGANCGVGWREVRKYLGTDETKDRGGIGHRGGREGEGTADLNIRRDCFHKTVDSGSDRKKEKTWCTRQPPKVKRRIVLQKPPGGSAGVQDDDGLGIKPTPSLPHGLALGVTQGANRSPMTESAIREDPPMSYSQ